MGQYDTCFEFNSCFLLFIIEEMYKCRYGTFIGNNESDKEEIELKKETISLWTYCNLPDVRETFLNPYYDKSSENIHMEICYSMDRLFFWKELYQKVVIS